MAGRGNPNWRKGQSGNPSGRPKDVAEVRDLARQHAAVAIETLINICRAGKSEAARIAAATAILDRGYGKPAQTINANVQRSLVDLTDEELAAIALGGGDGAAEPESGEGELSSLH